MTESIIKPKRPIGSGWRQIKLPLPILEQRGYPYEAWAHDGNGLGVVSAVEVARELGLPDLGPEYHLSISAFGARCSALDAAWVLGQFELLDAKEDNHTPSGRTRNFWRPVADPLSGIDCSCVDVEPAIREDKGDYVWRGVQP